jgi:hypothetical protein
MAAESNQTNWEQRKFEHDWALQGDLRQGMTEDDVNRMPRTSTLPKFHFNDPDFHYTDEDLHPPALLGNNKKPKKKISTTPTAQGGQQTPPVIGPDGYPTTLQKLDGPPPTQAPGATRDFDADKMKYLMHLGIGSFLVILTIDYFVFCRISTDQSTTAISNGL